MNSFHFVECTKTLCAPDAAEVHSDLFEGFQRSLTWNIGVPDRTVLTLEFPSGLAELSGAQKCPDGLQVSVSTTRSDRTVKSQRYCRSGTASRLELLGATSVTVEVPKEEELEGRAFTVTAAPRGARLLIATGNEHDRYSLLFSVKVQVNVPFLQVAGKCG